MAVQPDAGLPLVALRAATLRYATRIAGAQLIVLFGSTARGTARRDSDVDIGILGGSFWQQLELGSALAAELGREPHVVDLQQIPEALAYEIARSGIVLFESEAFTWARFQAQAALRFFDFQGVRERCADGVRQRVLAEAQKEHKGHG